MTGRPTLHKDLCTFLILSHWILLIMKNISDKSLQKIKETFYVYFVLFFKSCRLWIMWKHIVEPERPQMTYDVVQEICNLHAVCGPGRLVSIATGHGLYDPGIESRWEARFSAPVQNGSGAHPASCTMGTESFPGVKGGRGVKLTPHTVLVPWSWKGTDIPLLPLWTIRPVHGCTLPYLYMPTNTHS